MYNDGPSYTSAEIHVTIENIVLFLVYDAPQLWCGF